MDALAAITKRRGRPLNFEMAVDPGDGGYCAGPSAARSLPGAGAPGGSHHRGRPRRGRRATTVSPPSCVAWRKPVSASRASSTPDLAQVAAASSVGSQVIELHVGAYCQAVRERQLTAPALLEKIRKAAQEAARLGLEVHLGHGIDYETVKPLAAIPEVMELNIGHFLIGEAIFIGLGPAIQRNARAHGRSPRHESRGDHWPRFRSVGHPPDRKDPGAPRRAVHEPHLHRGRTHPLRAQERPRRLLRKRFAAKEACAKALGTGMRRGVFWKDMGWSTCAPASPPWP